jgi:hypothetical protein
MVRAKRIWSSATIFRKTVPSSTTVSSVVKVQSRVYGKKKKMMAMQVMIIRTSRFASRFSSFALVYFPAPILCPTMVAAAIASP